MSVVYLPYLGSLHSYLPREVFISEPGAPASGAAELAVGVCSKTCIPHAMYLSRNAGRENTSACRLHHGG
ncbi:uncharacterized protein LY79DRAFT_548709, partial [Colletotrichum navitas]